MISILYTAAMTLAVPALAVWFALSPGRRPMLGRFRPEPPRFEAPPLWVHACSVGEVNVAKPLLDALHRRWPEISLLLTVSTATGKAHAESLGLEVATSWYPFDHPLVVKRFLSRVRPQALILIESEIWPTAVAETTKSGAPVVLVNGRVSEARSRPLRRLGARLFLRDAASKIAQAGMQNQLYAERINDLGTPRDHISVMGNMKFDGAHTDRSEAHGTAFRQRLGIPATAPIIVFGSTRPGDEVLAVQCYAALKRTYPELRLIVAPRHLERTDEAMAPLKAHDVARVSTMDGATPNTKVFVLDTHGDLCTAYSVATIAVVGGSFYAGVDGHNPIEPAALGVATVFGPFMENFRDAAAALLAGGGAVQVESPEALGTALDRLLTNDTERHTVGARGREVVAQNTGATDLAVELIARALD